MLNEECKRQNENAKIFIIIDIKNIDSEDKVKPSGSLRNSSYWQNSEVSD